MAVNRLDIEAIFFAARQKQPWDRAAYLDEACGADTGLRQRVEQFLSAQADIGSFLEAPAPEFAATIDAHLTERPGTVIGPYTLRELIGEGGMGLVFVAEQQQPVRRKVALKVIKPGLDSRQVIARFEAERQALALMDHPNIARVLDAGTTDSGRPYFVMELVKGDSLTDYCDQNRLTTRQRLELFIPICHAVQHAHQKGVIHRDLKPANILVTLHDVTPVVKVIDFGIAKATGPLLTDKTVYTGLVQLLGTPQYMSPEQAGLSGLDVDTRTDVYSLGVLLYELVTGTTPFESEDLRKAGYDEMRRIIREDEPLKPSTRLSTFNQAALSTISERRSVDPRKLRHEIRDELDWIVMKALDKDRNRRYESASAFAADVQRYLNDEAVAACPPSAGYRMRKFTRRNQRALVTVGVIAVALIAATVVSAWQAVVARDSQHQAQADRTQAEADRKQAETDRDRAKSAERQAKTEQDRAKTAERLAATEAAIARAVNEFLQQDLLGQAASAPPTGLELGGGPYLTVKEALDRAAARIGQRFRDQPLVEAAVRTAIGEGYISLNDNPRAVPHLERAFALRKTELGPDDPNSFRSMEVLAQSYQWVVGRHSEQIALRQQLLHSRQALLGPDHSEVVERVGALADAYRAAGELDKSRQLCEQVLEKRRVLFGPKHSATLDAMNSLAANYRDAGQFEEAIKLNERVLEVLEAKKESESEWAYFARTQLSQGCMRAGKFDQADRLLRKGLQHYRNYEDCHARRLGLSTVLGWLALNLLLQEQYAAAEPLAREAVAISEKITPNSPRRFYWVSVLGAVLLGQNKYTEAEALLLQGYQGMEPQKTINPETKRHVIEAGGWIVRLYEATNQPENASAWRDKMKSKVPNAASDGFD
jgi:serine/threonine protein kinase/tetratricopeptide (TPR) repeat protein